MHSISRIFSRIKKSTKPVLATCIPRQFRRRLFMHFITLQRNLISCHCGHRKLSTIDRQIPVLDLAETGSILTFTFLHAYVLFVKDGTHINMSETNCYLPPVPKQKQYHGKIVIPWNWLKSGLKKNNMAWEPFRGHLCDHPTTQGKNVRSNFKKLLPACSACSLVARISSSSA